MKSSSNSLRIFAALTLLPFAAQINAKSFPIPESLGALSQQENYLKGNLSYLLGWQLTGMAKSISQLEAMCEDFHSRHYRKWEAAGLIPQYIELPICGNSSSIPTPGDVSPHQNFYETSVLLTQLLYSFNVSTQAEAYNYLCTNIHRNALSNLYLDGNRILAALCQEPDNSGDPSPQLPQMRHNLTILRTYRDSMSTLFGLEIAATARNVSELSFLCSDIKTHNGSLVGEMLNPLVVINTICGKDTTSLIRAARKSIANQISVTFLEVISVMSNAPGHLDWLCSHLDVHSMDLLGMLGSEVKLAICGLLVLK